MDVFEAPTWREASPGIAFALRYGSPADVEEATKALMQMARLSGLARSIPPAASSSRACMSALASSPCILRSLDHVAR